MSTLHRYSRRAVSRSVSQEAVWPGFKNVRNKRCRVCTRDEIRSLRPRTHGEKPFRTPLCECVCVHLTSPCFDSTLIPPPDTHLLMRQRLLDLFQRYHLPPRKPFSFLVSPIPDLGATAQLPYTSCIFRHLRE